jgi:mono/diheme cytochrome c family protein
MTHSISKHRPVFTLLFIIMSACVFMAFTKSTVDGKALFERNCARCHGANGAKGFFGAANLKKSVMTEEAIIERIENGKRFMPSFKKKFTPEEIKELAGYVKTLRAK